MKDYRFYLECHDREKCISTGNVVAVFVGNGSFIRSGRLCYKALARQGLARWYSHPNSPVTSTGVALEFLGKYCHRVSEALARQIHPELFHRLDRRTRNRGANKKPRN